MTRPWIRPWSRPRSRRRPGPGRERGSYGVRGGLLLAGGSVLALFFQRLGSQGFHHAGLTEVTDLLPWVHGAIVVAIAMSMGAAAVVLVGGAKWGRLHTVTPQVHPRPWRRAALVGGALALGLLASKDVLSGAARSPAASWSGLWMLWQIWLVRALWIAGSLCVGVGVLETVGMLFDRSWRSRQSPGRAAAHGHRDGSRTRA